MAEPKGTYYSARTPETGWATVLPDRPHRSYANMLAKELGARKKAADAEQQAKVAAIGKLRGADFGKLHGKVAQDAIADLIDRSPNLSAMDITNEVVRIEAAFRSTKHVAKTYDDGVKWIENKNNPVKKDALRDRWASKFANPSLDTAAEWESTPPQITDYLQEVGGSQFVDANRAVKMVIKDQFAGFASDKSEWTRSGWEQAPIGYVADMTTLQTKVQAFSKYDPKTNEVVMKDGTELLRDDILAPFTQNENTNRVLEDEAIKRIAERKGIGLDEVDPLDVNDAEKAEALSDILRPYVQGVVSERGMTLAIRPSGGGGGGKDEKFERGFDLWVYQLSQGSQTAAKLPAGGKIGQTNEEVLAFDALTSTKASTFDTVQKGKLQTGTGSSAKGMISILASPDAVRRNFEAQDWFKGLTPEQKNTIVNDTYSSGSPLVGKAKVVYTLVTRTPKLANQQQAQVGRAGTQQTGYDYRVVVIDPETTDRSTLRLLYNAGYRAGGNVHYDVYAGKEGEKQAGYQYEQAPWGGVNQAQSAGEVDIPFKPKNKK